MHLFRAPKTSVYIYKVRGKNIFGCLKFKTKVKTVEDMLNELKAVKENLRKKYKTKKISIMKDTTGNKEWMAVWKIKNLITFMDKEKKVLKLIKDIKSPRLRAELRKDFMKLVELKRKKAELDSAAFDEALSKHGIKFKSTKLH